MAEDIVEKLLSRIKVNAVGCFEWQGRRNAFGYGQITHERKTWVAHRLSFTVFRKPIPDGLQTCHSCDNPSCINPAHLFLGTQTDNMRDASAKGRLAKGRQKFSAKLTEENVVEMGNLYNNGYSVRHLAKQFGVSHETARNILNGRKWQSVEREKCDVTKCRPTKNRQGIKHPRAKLNDDIVRQIRHEYAIGCRPVDIARVYGVSPSLVSSIAARRYWSHVAD